MKNLEKNKIANPSLSTILLIIAIIIIVIMGIFIFLLQSKSRNEISKLENDTNALQNTIDNLQNNIDQISNTSSEESTINSATSDNMLTSNTLAEKQHLEGNGYTTTLYSNNEVWLTPSMEDLQVIFGDTNLSGTNESCIVTGFSGEIEKMYQGNNGGGIDPITFFIMKDGTVQYALPLTQIISNNNTIPTSFTVDGTIDNLNNVIDLKTNSDDTIIAITKDGEEIKCWNTWEE